MTWKEFVKTVEAQLSERGVPENTPIRFIDWSSDLQYGVHVNVHEEKNGLDISITED